MRKFFSTPPGLLAQLADRHVVQAPPAKLTGPEILNVKQRIIRGAAEFLWQHKKRLHRHGLLALDLPRGADLPLWMSFVLEELRLRPRHWRVQEVLGDRRGKRYLVKWLGWMKNAKRRRK